MVTTPVSLLQKLRRPEDGQAWGEFVELYTPLLLAWARKLGLQDADATDLVQDVFVLLLRKMPGFVYDPSRSFRGWLRTIATNEWRARRARAARVCAAPLADDAEVAAHAEEGFWEEEYRRHLVQRALQLMQCDFETSTWKACWETVVNGRAAIEVAGELGMQAGTVRAARFRVLHRLRERLDGMLD
jgi:RNA polymerase sigma-70 factor (ECF subfamily)